MKISAIDENRHSLLAKKGPIQVFQAKYSYDPFQHSPNENPDAELPINAGDYVLVYGEMDEVGRHTDKNYSQSIHKYICDNKLDSSIPVCRWNIFYLYVLCVLYVYFHQFLLSFHIGWFL